MPSQLDPVRLAGALQELGITPAALHAIRSARPDQAKAMLEELKQVAKSRYRKLAFELHPDRNNGDPEKTAKFAFLSQVIKQVESMEVRPAPPPPPFRTVPGPVYPQQPGPPVRQVRVAQVVFRAVPAVTIFNRARTGNSAAKGTVQVPAGIHVVSMRPT